MAVSPTPQQKNKFARVFGKSCITGRGRSVPKCSFAGWGLAWLRGLFGAGPAAQHSILYYIMVWYSVVYYSIVQYIIV